MSDERLVVSGNEPGATLELLSDGEDFKVTLIDKGLRAEGGGWWNIEMKEARHLGEFFKALASSWKGWGGEKKWNALEVPFHLSATHDGLGHITLKVRLHSGWYPPVWRAETDLLLDAGALDELATRVQRFLSDS